MDKYSGCNRPDCTVTVADKPKVNRKKRHTVLRYVVSAALIAFICLTVYLPYPPLSAARAAVKRVLCYDVFGREPGTSAVVEYFASDDA